MENTQICIISSQNSYENNEKNIIKSIKDEYTNNMIDLETINETNNNLIEPIIEFKSNYLKSVQEDGNKKEKKMYNDYKQELEDILFSSDIEWGIYSEFDKFVMEHVEDEYLMKAINELPKTIKRRIKMFYFEELTTSQIATLEHCSDRMIRKSLEQGRNKIKYYFEKNKLI